MSRSALLNVMIQAARKAARSVSRDFGEIEQLQTSSRNPKEFALATVRKAESIIIDSLRKSRPGYCFLSPENGHIKDSDESHRFVISVLSDVENFIHAFPFVAISIALEREGQPISAIVYNPILNELFTTEKGKGVFLNDKRLRVSARTTLDGAMILCPPLPHDLPEAERRLARSVSERVAATVCDHRAVMRCMGSAPLSLAFVSIGRADSCFIRDTQACNTLAGALLVREAGGFISKLKLPGQNESEKTMIVAGNETINKGILSLFT